MAGRYRPIPALEKICPFCEVVFTTKKPHQKYCSPGHESKQRTRERSARLLQQKTDRTCVGCSVSIADRNKGSERCLPCGREWKRSRDTRRAATQSARLKEERLKVVRLCVDCPTSIADRAPQVLRCQPCRAIFVRARDTRAQREKREREKQGTYPSKILTSVAHKAAQHRLSSIENLNKRQPTRRAPSGLVAPKQPKNKIMPNLKGDWYPGWSGCYSNNLSPLAVELLKGETGRPHIKTTNQTMQSSGHDRVLRRPSNIPEDLVTIQVAEKRKAG